MMDNEKAIGISVSAVDGSDGEHVNLCISLPQNGDGHLQPYVMNGQPVLLLVMPMLPLKGDPAIDVSPDPQRAAMEYVNRALQDVSVSLRVKLDELQAGSGVKQAGDKAVLAASTARKLDAQSPDTISREGLLAAILQGKEKGEA